MIELSDITNNIPDADPQVDPEKANAFETLLELLNPAEREVVDLRFRAGMKVVEIATELSVSERTVIRRLKRAYGRGREWVRE